MLEMELPCVPLPIPKHAQPANSANKIPSHFCFKPLSRAYMGPPIRPPSFPFTLYLIARIASPYLEAIPKQPVSHTQNTAPGPPDAIAVATPTMLPVPMVAANAVASAPKPDTSPLASLSGVTESLMPLNTYLWITLVRSVRNTCVPNNSTSMTGPHTTPWILEITSIILIPSLV